jgi:hypothetical protein
MKKAKRILIGTFYLIFFILSIVFLSAAQFRSSSGSLFDTWKLNYDSILLLKNKYESDLQELNISSDNNWDRLNWTEQCLSLYDPQNRLKSEMDIETKQDLNAVRKGKKKSEELTDYAQCIYRGLINLRYDQNYYKKKDNDLKDEIANVKNLLKSAQDQCSEMVKGHQEFLAFIKMEKIWYTKPLVSIPYDLLILFLVSTMGILGGIIRIIRDYGDSNRNNPSTKDYFFIPVIGAIVSIGGYILAKTGLLLLSSTKGETSLSPFMIALVGIISGLLAKEVVDRISAYGHDLLEDKSVTKVPAKSQTGKKS